MIIKATRNLNLHSESFNETRADQQGLIFVPADTLVKVPDDVKDGPLFDLLVKSGTITVMRGKKNGDAVEAKPAFGQPNPPIKPLEDEDAPIQTAQAASLVPQAQGVATEDEEEGTEEGEESEESEEPESLIPQAEKVDEDEVEEEDEEPKKK